MLPESKHFLRKIRRGSIVKVYSQTNGKPKYGKVLRTETAVDPRHDDGRTRQIVILQPTREYNLDEVDYCLDWYKAKFI